ncbi:hypothetical protein TRVL_06190 [Trypanosoma vivax]|uniref:Uncharacterized protein n=1 Tax=Trypanosoma vivax (strain Y486) TaxID=1055687 RepID=G0TRP0_TRYVY|nr:hypothetical protein TRVL_06190 [Trypanosoma vivax]CCC46611.1 conserved hypothetical protein [Trypanosoma vivax Y486]
MRCTWRSMCTGRHGHVPHALLWYTGGTTRGLSGSSLHKFASERGCGTDETFNHQRRRSCAPCTAASSPVSPPLWLDPPFTEVPGEKELLSSKRQRALDARGVDSLRVVYRCTVCNSSLFHSDDYAPTSTVGRHSSGWPSFVAPASPKSLDIRSLLQRTALEAGRRTSVRESGGTEKHTAGTQLASLGATLAARGLRVEGEMRRVTRSGRCEIVAPKTWREMCLRDVNKRSDPALMEGCCSVCGVAVCRVVTINRGAVKFVANPTALLAAPLSDDHQK